MIEILPLQPTAPGPQLTAPRSRLPQRADAGTSAVPAPSNIRRTIREDQICVLTFDRPGSSANIFDRPTLLELAAELDFVAGAPDLEGLVIMSAKRSIFIAGADLKMMSEETSLEDVRELIELGQKVMNQLAGLPIPTVAAIHGAALGGGYELCLACDYRVASPDRVTRLGLPETQLGLLPAWGGSTRLPRLIGLPAALDIILGGKTLAAKPALKRGLVDELAPTQCLTDAARRLICRGKPCRAAHRLFNNPLAGALVAVRLRRHLHKKTRGHYPAVDRALEVITRGISKSIPHSLALEREGVLELVQTSACRNLIRIFFLQEESKKRGLRSGELRQDAEAPQDMPRITVRPEARETGQPGGQGHKPPARCAVIGSGVMGAGIAQWLSARQLPVVLRDINAEQLAKGMAAIAAIYKAGVKRHALSAHEAREGMDRIYPAAVEVPLRQADLIIEAAVERFDLKQQIFRHLDELAREDAILATNTSALPISELAAQTRRPERVLGLHFFNPVHRMQLVEVIAARQTAPEVLERALRFVQQIGKLPVLVKDSPGFLVNRVLMPYLVEAGNLFAAGASVTDLDEAMLDFGMPMGPMSLLDEVGVDVALHVAKTLEAHYSDRMRVPSTLGEMVQAGLLGRKTGQGFYLHHKGKPSRPNPQAAAYQTVLSARESARSKLQERLVLLIVNEAARCLEEQIVSEPADVDFAMIMGTGFAPFRGGPLRYADSLGAAKVVGAMERLVETGAAHFEPCALVRSMARNEQSFYKDQSSVSYQHRVCPV